MFGWFKKEPQQVVQVFRYKYLHNPFDNPRYFTVTANNREEADTKARQHFDYLFSTQQTVMTMFWRA